MASIMERFRPEEFWITPQALEDPSAGNVILSARKHGALIKTIDGSIPDILMDGTKFEFLAPPPGSGKTDRNDASAVIRISGGGRSFLLTGDIQKKAEEFIIDSGRTVESEVMKAPHHGGARSSNHAFLDAVHPSWAVIMAGVGNPHHLPGPVTLNRLSEHGIRILRTDLHGTIRFHGQSEPECFLKNCR